MSVWALETTDGEIVAIRSIVNPEKLAHLGPLADFAALVSGHRHARATETVGDE